MSEVGEAEIRMLIANYGAGRDHQLYSDGSDPALFHSYDE